MKKIGIIGAMDSEVALFREEFSAAETNVSGIYRGTDGKNELYICRSGVGKVNAAIAAQKMIDFFGVEKIINSGVAGALSDKLGIADIVIADKVVQHDMDTSALGDPAGMISDINMIYLPADARICAALKESVEDTGIGCEIGTIASGDQFVSDGEIKNRIVQKFGAKSCEMEGGAIGHVCYVNNVPFGVLRAMSDGADDGAKLDFPAFAKKAAENSTKVIKNFLTII